MDFEIVLSQGLAADKTPYTLMGAAQTAITLQNNYGANITVVGQIAQHPNEIDWSVSLPEAAKTLDAVARAIELAISRSKLTVLCSNTCSISLASLPVVAKFHPDVALLWIDAHCDFNTPATTKSGYLGGMVVSAACGLWDSGHGAGLDPENVFFVGARDIDESERRLVVEAGSQIMPPAEFDISRIMDFVGDRKVWIHVDWDVLEPGHVNADYEVEGGLYPLQIKQMFQAFAPDAVIGIELAEYKAFGENADPAKTMNKILDIVAPLLDRPANLRTAAM